MVSSYELPPDNSRSSSLLKVVFGLLIVVGMLAAIYLVAVGIALSSFEIELGEEFEEEFEEWKMQIQVAALRDTEQITEIEIPDQFSPSFGTSGDTRITDILKNLIGFSDLLSVKAAVFMIWSEQMEIDQSENKSSDFEGVLCLVQLSEEDAKKVSFNDFKTRLEEGDLSLNKDQIIESTRISRVIREEPATFLLIQQLEDSLGGKEAWILMGFFRGKESPACVVMVVNTERMKKKQILAMINSIR